MACPHQLLGISDPGRKDCGLRQRVWFSACIFPARMESFTSFFELHIGFPRQEQAQDTVGEFLAKIRAQSSPDWSRSAVRSVHLTKPGCIDPHNVPGTLGWLVSRKIYQNSGSWEHTIERTILPACDHALEQLNRLGLTDARLEIEFPFACREACMVGDRLVRSSWSEDPMSIEPSKLAFPFGVQLDDVPQWEIHFLLEQIPGTHASRPFDVTEVAAYLSRYGIEAEQTIEYQSQSMVAEGRDDFRLIATAYYDSSAHTVQEAERLFHATTLCQDAADRGYNTRLILEHIVTCFQPKDTRAPGLSVESFDEVKCAS